MQESQKALLNFCRFFLAKIVAIAVQKLLHPPCQFSAIYKAMKAIKTKCPRARLPVIAAAIAGIALCACGNLFSADSDQTETRISVSSETMALLSEAGVQVESWTLCCYFASGNYIEETSASGVFSVQFSDRDIAAVFAKPAISSPKNLDESAVPSIGALYPYYGELSGSALKPSARLVLDFYGGVAAEAARLIFGGADEDAARLAAAFNWSKFDNHLKTASRAVSRPLLIDMDKFLTAFFEGNTSMYWQVRSLEMSETEITVPKEVRSSGAEIVFPYFYPDHALELESDDGSLPEILTLDLPDGQWFFLVPGSGKWFAIQAKDGKVSASYSSDDL